VFLSRVLTAIFGCTRRGTLRPDFGHHEMKSAVTHTPPDQMVQDGTSTIEDYLDDVKQPHMAAQVKQEVDMIAKWRRQHSR
jgi:hypothetical protein